MGFIHHTTGAAGATGLMAESVRLPRHPCIAHSGLTATGLTGPSVSAMRIGDRLLCYADRAAAPDETRPGRATVTPIPAPRIRIVKGQDH
jgi:hypothetical protein